MSRVSSIYSTTFLKLQYFQKNISFWFHEFFLFKAMCSWLHLHGWPVQALKIRWQQPYQTKLKIWTTTKEKLVVVWKTLYIFIWWTLKKSTMPRLIYLAIQVVLPDGITPGILLSTNLFSVWPLKFFKYLFGNISKNIFLNISVYTSLC